MSASLTHPEGMIVDWPASWDKPTTWPDGPKSLRFMRKLWLARWPFIIKVLRNWQALDGPESVSALLPRLKASTTAMQAVSMQAESMFSDEILAAAFNDRWEELPEPVTVLEGPPDSVPEGYVRVDTADDGGWVYASFADCAAAAACIIVEGLIEHICERSDLEVAL